MKSYNSYVDTELVALIVTGDEVAFNEIYKRYWKRLYSGAYKRVRNAELCEEVLQDVFVDLWNRHTNVQIHQLSAYLETAVRYQLLTLYRKGKSLPVFEEPVDHMILDPVQADSSLNEKELRASINNWLDSQPAKRKEIFQMRFMQELSTNEISEILGISRKTVQNQLLTVTGKLRKHLGEGLTFSAIVLLMKSN